MASRKLNSSSGRKSKDSNLDLTNLPRGVWLVKVPKYIDELWKSAPSDIEVAKMKFNIHDSKISSIDLNLSEAILTNDSGIPRHHKIEYEKTKNEKIAVFSESSGGDDPQNPGQRLKLEGCVTTKFRVQPAEHEKYMAMKCKSFRSVAKVRKPVKILDRVVNTYKPVSNHKHIVEFERKKKAEGPKVRADKHSVMDMLFEAFEKHQFYNFKDLVKITRQPVPYLKECLKEIGNFNPKPPHKNMWELKPEYRHYNNNDNKVEKFNES